MERIVQYSSSMAELVRNLGYKTSHGKNYETVGKKLKEYGISTSHFIITKSNRSFTEEDVFCKDSTVGQSTLRRFYKRRNDIEYKCSKCGIGPIWDGEELALQLDHIDGDNKNNLPDNLRWLCPNCHSQTKTFAGKNIHKERKRYYCIDCGNEIERGSDRCVECASLLRRKTERPSKDELIGLLKSHKGNFTAIANIYNVSDNAIRKWCKFYELPTHTKDYKNIT